MNFIYAGSLLLVVTIQLVYCMNLIDPISCPSGWVVSGSRCYINSTKIVKSDDEAKAACLLLDPKATIPTTHNEAELTFLLTAFKTGPNLDVYIGLKFDDQLPVQEWKWDDGAGDLKHYHPWSPDADYSGDSGHCVDLELGQDATPGWNTNNCKQEKNLVCQQIVPNIIDVYTMLTDVKKDIANMKQECQIVHK